MKSIALNEKKLHEVSMLLRPSSPGTISSLRYPKSNFKYRFEDDKFYLEIPAYLAVELYRSRILPEKKSDLVKIKESGVLKGSFLLHKIIYSSDAYEKNRN